MAGKYNTWFFKKWMKFLTWFGDLYCATEIPKIKEAHIAQAYSLLQTGDIVQRKYTYYMDGYFIKGAYSHSSFCLEKPVLGNKCLTDIIAEGNRRVGLTDFIKDCDGFRIIRPKLADETQLNIILNRAEKFANTPTPYDGYIDTDNGDAMYCHEYVARIVCGEHHETEFNKGAGIKYTMGLPASIIYAEWFDTFCDVIYVSHC